jgi:ribose transport system ATP-binding protein
MLLEVSHISKSFPGVRALSDVSLGVDSGEVLGIVGENGAGKSTLIKILCGDYERDSGLILIDGAATQFRSPADSRNAGVRAIHQELQCFDTLSVAENIFVGEMPARSALRQIDWSRVRREANEVLERMGVSLHPDTLVGDLSVHEKQVLEIAKAVHRKARILVMDEPTAALGRDDIRSLFSLIDGLQKQGVGIIYVSHRMEEVFEITDRVAVLRDGRHVGTRQTRDTNPQELVSMMVGEELDFGLQTAERSRGEEVFRVQGLCIDDLITDVSFNVHAGEVLGFFGLLGSGRLNILAACYGLEKPTSGEMLVRGTKVSINSPSDAMAVGIGYMPLDRKLDGLALPISVQKNITMNNIDHIGKGPLIDRAIEQNHAQQWFDRVRIKAVSMETEVGTLSGGNQQKIVLAKMLETDSKILILVEPTRGIDVATKAEIYDIVDDLCRHGCAVLLVTSEIPEMIRLADRIMVISRGRVMAELPKREADQQTLLNAATK